MKKMILLWVAIISGCLLSTSSYAQKQGNIVEYFGKEHIETTGEGEVFHQFKEGLMLPGAFRQGSLFNGQDLLAWQLAVNRYETPRPGLVVSDRYAGAEDTLVWEELKVDSTLFFRDRALRRGYLYTSFISPREGITLLETTGSTRVFINGLPHEGDHYDFGYTLIPVELRKGLNEFIFTPGRFGRVRAKLVAPSKPVLFTKRDMTLPDIIIGETDAKWAAVRIVNTTPKVLTGLSLECVLTGGESVRLETDDVMALSVRKVKFKVPSSNVSEPGKADAQLLLRDIKGKVLDSTLITLQIRTPGVHHERTFISNIDGSVQYYSVAPSTVDSARQALVLSVHGASVEARNQARAYSQKDWAHIVAPTNRRPFGFNWEEWGRIDAMEVLAEAKEVFQTEDSLTYLTGHSMGGHGTWYLGATYPDRFAAIAPCASYPDIIGYGRRGREGESEESPHMQMIRRGANAGRVLSLKRNLTHSGVYIFHGSDDNVVSVEQARMMRGVLGEFHDDFCYYEYPGGTHWFGNESVDWPPIFDYFKWHYIPSAKSVKHIEFQTASPAISASNYWVRINQQTHPYDFSEVVFDVAGDTVKGTTQNVQSLTLALDELAFEKQPVVVINHQVLMPGHVVSTTFEQNGGQWQMVDGVNKNEKHPGRYGGFKQAFDNGAVLVYATGGSREENEWYKNKARFDAETFLYRGNGSFDVIPDREFNPSDFPNRNVVIYGHAGNNKAWKKLLAHAPVQVEGGKIVVGDKILVGEDLGAYFIYPRKDSDRASVGVVAGTGPAGMKSTFANNYFSGITGFPDLLIFRADLLKDGLEAMEVSGFFGNDWSVERGDFVYDGEL